MAVSSLSQRERRKRVRRSRRARREPGEELVAFVDLDVVQPLVLTSREHARRVLEWSGGRRELAAETLGIDVRTLRKLIRND